MFLGKQIFLEHDNTIEIILFRNKLKMKISSSFMLQTQQHFMSYFPLKNILQTQLLSFQKLHVRVEYYILYVDSES